MSLLVELVDLHVVLTSHLVELCPEHCDVCLRVREVVLQVPVLVDGVVQLLLRFLRVLLVFLLVQVRVDLERKNRGCVSFSLFFGDCKFDFNKVLIISNSMHLIALTDLLEYFKL